MSSTSETPIEKVSWYALYSVRAKMDLCEQLEALRGEEMLNPHTSESYLIYDVYVPTEIRTLKTPRGLRKYRALVVGSYVFIKATLNDIIKLKHDTTHLKSDIRFVKLDRVAGSHSYATVADHEITNLRKALSEMEAEKIEFFQPTKVILEKGDKVRVTGGRFQGVEGVLLTQQGKSGGRLIVSVSNLLAIKTLSIEPEHIQILEFAKGSSRSYKSITKFCEFIEAVLGSEKPLTATQEEQINSYIKRYQFLHLDGKLKQRFDIMMGKAKMMLKVES